MCNVAATELRRNDDFGSNVVFPNALATRLVQLAKLNKMPTMWQAGVYSSILHYLNAIKATDTDGPLKVAAKMREMPVSDFFSRNGKLREDGLMIHDLYLVQVKKPGGFQIRMGLLPAAHHHSGPSSLSACCSGMLIGKKVSDTGSHQRGN
jgi:hypothetical protein